MDDATLLARALAQVWDRIAAALGPERQHVEYELIGLLRHLELGNAAERAAAVAATLALFQAHAAAQAVLLPALRSTQASRAKGGAGPAGSVCAERYTRFPVFFGTDRAQANSSSDAVVAFDSARGRLVYGLAEVSIPDDARMGHISRPRWWKLEFRADPNKHLLVHAVQLLSGEAFAARAKTTLAGAAKKEVLVFVHGFKVAFQDALTCAAQLAYDLHFEGLAALYSWPSEGALTRYAVDEGNVLWSRPHFVQFLALLREQTGADAVHLVAHSMGNRLLLDALTALPQPPAAAAAPLREVVFAAPDVDAATFKEQLTSLRSIAQRFTLYASSQDKALMLSQTVHRYARAGQSGLDLVLAQTIDTVDASAVDTSLLGHSYHAENRSVLSDLFALIRHGHVPKDRGLREMHHYGMPYWAFRA